MDLEELKAMLIKSKENDEQLVRMEGAIDFSKIFLGSILASNMDNDNKSFIVKTLCSKMSNYVFENAPEDHQDGFIDIVNGLKAIAEDL